MSRPWQRKEYAWGFFKSTKHSSPVFANPGAVWQGKLMRAFEIKKGFRTHPRNQRKTHIELVEEDV